MAADRRRPRREDEQADDERHGNTELRRAEVEKHKQMIDVSAALGGSFCRVLSGQRRPEVGVEEGIGYTVECITALLPHAESRGVPARSCLHAHNATQAVHSPSRGPLHALLPGLARHVGAACVAEAH